MLTPIKILLTKCRNKDWYSFLLIPITFLIRKDSVATEMGMQYSIQCHSKGQFSCNRRANGIGMRILMVTFDLYLKLVFAFFVNQRAQEYQFGVAYVKFYNCPNTNPLIQANSSHESRGGGHFNSNCTGVCGHRIGKLTHPQTKAGPKTDPILRLFAIEID